MVLYKTQSISKQVIPHCKDYRCTTMHSEHRFHNNCDHMTAGLVLAYLGNAYYLKCTKLPLVSSKPFDGKQKI